MRKPTAAFVGAGWTALAIFATTYLIAIARMGIPDVEAFFYITVFLFGIFGVIALTKAIRDREEGIPVTGAFIGASWAGTLTPMILMAVYLLNVSGLNELQRGLLFLTFIAGVFAMVVVQKNFRDVADYNKATAHAVEVVE